MIALFKGWTQLLRSLLPEAAVSKGLKLIRLSAEGMAVRVTILAAMCVRSQLCAPGPASWPPLGARTHASRVFNIYAANNPEDIQNRRGGLSVKSLVLHLPHLRACHAPFTYPLHLAAPSLSPGDGARLAGLRRRKSTPWEASREKMVGWLAARSDLSVKSSSEIFFRALEEYNKDHLHAHCPKELILFLGSSVFLADF